MVLCSFLLVRIIILLCQQLKNYWWQCIVIVMYWWEGLFFSESSYVLCTVGYFLNKVKFVLTFKASFKKLVSTKIFKMSWFLNLLVNSYRNTISEWAVGFRYGNFFIPWVEKNLKISPWEGKSCLPWANFWSFFQPLGWRNSHTWNSAHPEILYFCIIV